MGWRNAYKQRTDTLMNRSRNLKLYNALFMLAVGLLPGCSTVKTIIPKMTGPTIIVVRDTGYTGSGCIFKLLIDSDIVSELSAGQIFVKQVPSGKYRVSIDNATASCPNISMTKIVDVLSDPLVLRIGITSNFQTIFDQVE